MVANAVPMGSDLGNFNKVIGIILASTIGLRVFELLRPPRRGLAANTTR